MYLSALIGSAFTVLIILASKMINKYFGTHVPTPPNECNIFEYLKVKSLLFALYIFGMSSLIAGMWIVNTLNLLGENLQLHFGDFVFYVATTFNLLSFILLYKCQLQELLSFMASLHHVESRDSSPNTPVIRGEKINTSLRTRTRTTIFL